MVTHLWLVATMERHAESLGHSMVSVREIDKKAILPVYPSHCLFYDLCSKRCHPTDSWP